MDLEAIKKDLLNFENSLEYQLFHLNFALILSSPQNSLSVRKCYEKFLKSAQDREFQDILEKLKNQIMNHVLGSNTG